MATQTTNYNLVKPALTDSPPDITVMNPNWDKIDSELKINSSAIGQKADKTQVSNPDLLINGDFPIWQRGTSFGSGVYSADRWITFSATGGVQVTRDTDNSLKISASKAEYAGIAQVVEGKYRDLLGKKVTISAKVKSTIPILLSVEANGTTFDSAVFSASAGYTIISKTVTLPASINENTLRALIAGNQQIGTINVAWVKLELGDIATPFSPRTIAEELAMCQRYYLTNIFGRAGQVEANNIYFSIPISKYMRVPPTITSTIINNIGGIQQSGFTVSSFSQTSNAITVLASKTSHGLADGSINAYGVDAEIY